MRKKISTVFIMCLLTLAAGAQTMADIWKAIPDTVIPYIDQNHRLEMTEFINMGLKGDVDNSLGGKSEMDTITNDYIHVTLNENATMEIKRLPTTGSDSIICVVNTWRAPEGESQVRFFTTGWQPISIDKPFGGHELEELSNILLQRPDTMSQSTFDKLRSKIDFTIIKASLSPDNDDITVEMSAPMLSKDDEKLLQPLFKLKKFKWNKERFNL